MTAAGPEPIRPGDRVVLRSAPEHVVLVTDVGPRTRSERGAGEVEAFEGFSGWYVPEPGARQVPALNQDVQAYRHATEQEITAALERGVLPERE